MNLTLRLFINYRKIPKISPGAYIFQRPFFEGLIFGGAYLRKEICVSKSIGLPCSGFGWLMFGGAYFRNFTVCVHMHESKTKFERNSSQEYYHMTCIGKTKHTS